MSEYKEFIEGLQEDIKVPEKVSNRFEQTLDNLPEIPVATIPKDRHRFNVWTKVAASVAVLVLGTAFCMANPVLASKIPIIGKIFERVEDDLTYSGNYNERADILTNEQEWDSVVESAYTVKDQGIEFTASEVYCDGYSIFLTAKVTVDSGGLDDMYPGYESDTQGTNIQRMYIGEDWKLYAAGLIEQSPRVSQFLEGEAIDDNTFVGMLKIDLHDLSQIEEDNGAFDLQISMIGYDGMSDSVTDNIDIGHRFEGNWNLSIPYTVDKENAKLIEVNEKSADGFGVQKVFISPYQVLVYVDVPYTTMTGDSYSEGQLMESLGENIKESVEETFVAEEKSFIYEDEKNQKLWSDFDVVVYNQDNQKLAWQEAGLVDDAWVAKFSVSGLEVSKLQIFINDEWLSLIKAEDYEDVTEKAVWSIEIDM